MGHYPGCTEALPDKSPQLAVCSVDSEVVQLALSFPTINPAATRISEFQNSFVFVKQSPAQWFPFATLSVPLWPSPACRLLFSSPRTSWSKHPVCSSVKSPAHLPTTATTPVDKPFARVASAATPVAPTTSSSQTTRTASSAPVRTTTTSGPFTATASAASAAPAVSPRPRCPGSSPTCPRPYPQSIPARP